MEKPEVVRYGDGHYRRTIYGLGPYIADYPEQVLLACIVQGWCPKYVFLVLFVYLCLRNHDRCTANARDLDGEAGRRHHDHTLSLFEALDKKSLWYDYGIVDDIMVSSTPFLECSHRSPVLTALHVWLSAC